MGTVNTTLYVEGVHFVEPPEPSPVEYWVITCGCWVREEGVGWRTAKEGEVEVVLIERKAWMPDATRDTKLCNADGVVSFNEGANYPSVQYALEAKHGESGDTDGVIISCHEDGTWEEKSRYKP